MDCQGTGRSVEPAAGLEPAASELEGRCSGPVSYAGLVPSTRVERATTAASRPRLFHWATRACSRQGPFRFAGGWMHPAPTRLRALPWLPGQDSNPAPRIQSAVSYRIDDPGMVAGEPRTRRPVISAAPVGLPGQASAGCGIIHWGAVEFRICNSGGDFPPLVKYGSGSRNRTCVCTGIQSPVALASRAPRNG